MSFRRWASATTRRANKCHPVPRRTWICRRSTRSSSSPPGWKYRVKALDRDLEIQAVNGVARIVQDHLENTYDACFEEGGEKACTFKRYAGIIATSAGKTCAKRASGLR